MRKIYILHNNNLNYSLRNAMDIIKPNFSISGKVYK